MHLKNFSLIRRENKVELSPAYDLINSSIVINSGEELALPLRGKKSNLKRADFVEYFGIERLGLTEAVVEAVLAQCREVIDPCRSLIQNSFLSQEHKQRYLDGFQNRFDRIC